MKIVLRYREPKTIIDVVETNTMTLIEERIISAGLSCAAEKRLDLMGTVISFAVGAEIGDKVSQGAMPTMVKGATVQIVAQPEEMLIMGVGLKEIERSSCPLSPISWEQPSGRKQGKSDTSSSKNRRKK